MFICNYMNKGLMRVLFWLLIVSFLDFACTSQKKTIYLQGSGNADSSAIFNNQFAAYLIHAGDVLYIRIISLNKELTALFNFDSEIPGSYSYSNEVSLYYKGYTVSDDGDVEIPVIGKIHTEGLTLDEAQVVIQQSVDKMLKDAKVIVKFGGFKFTVLGEVKRPGLFYYYNNRLTILEALGQAGDLSDMGNRENILVVRPTKNGSTTFRVNLLDKNLLQSPYFYLSPNDVVYVEPVKTKNWKLNAPNISIILSSITTTILVINFIFKF